MVKTNNNLENNGISSIDYSYIRPKKATVLRSWHNNNLNGEPFYEKKELITESYEKATILPLKNFAEDNLMFGRGGVVDKDNNYVNISAIDNRMQFSYDFTNPIIKNEKVVYCGYLVNHWGHFLVEAVSRLWYFLENDSTIDKYVFFIKENEKREISGNYKEFFQLLGIWDKLEIINKPTQYREVLVPERGYKWRIYFSQQYKNIFNTIADNITINPQWKSYEKIFFTRSQLASANFTDIGTPMVDSFFFNNNYKIVSPEKISLSELIFLIRNAKECASISGSLPHNMLFGYDSQKLIIIERNILNNEIQADINNIKQLNTTYIDANLGLYTVNIGFGPFLLCYKGLLEKYAKDNNLNPPDSQYISDKYIKKCLQKYMKTYNRAYHYEWFMSDWSVQYTDYQREAYLDSLNYVGDYIYGIKPFKFSHYFQLHYIKQIIKSIIRR